VYRGEQLPEPNQVITVTTKLSPVSFSPRFTIAVTIFTAVTS
jgi:hypothetical protein